MEKYNKKEEKCLHDWERVSKLPVYLSEILEYFPQIELVASKSKLKFLAMYRHHYLRKNEELGWYVGTTVYRSTILDDKLGYNKVCLNCGECVDVVKKTKDWINSEMKRIDIEIQNEIDRKALAEKIWKDCNER
jgi:hypothetical protein